MYMRELNLSCKRCQKKLDEHEGRYCDNCVKTMEKAKQDRLETDTVRACKDCGIDMINPAPNRKWCEVCAVKQKSTYIKTNNARRKSVRQVQKENNLPPTIYKDRYVNTINPMFLTRGTISNNNRMSAMEA